MFTRIVSLALIFITLSVHAAAPANNGIKAAFDDLNYSLSVEWDQKDINFFNAQSEKFSKSLQELQKSGLSNQEMLDGVLNELHDKKLAQDIQATYSLVSINAMGPEEAQAQVKELLEKSYNKGASWSGATTIVSIVAIVAIVALVAVINKDKLEKKAEQCYMAYKCHDYCTITGCNQVCGDECI